MTAPDPSEAIDALAAHLARGRLGRLFSEHHDDAAALEVARDVIADLLAAGDLLVAAMASGQSQRPDQRDRFPGRLARYRVGAYVEFDVWAGDRGDACIIVTHLGIPDASMQPCVQDPLPMEGRVGRKRVTAEAYRLRCLSVHENPEETPSA